MFVNNTVGTIRAEHIANRDIYNFTQVGGSKPVLKILYEKAAPGGFHISDKRYDPPKCHKDTRTTIRQDLLDQVKIAVVSCIIWLYGAAGAGKSAIAQSVAETCEEEGLLIGTFFFFRTAPLRNNAQRLAATLAYQLARSIPLTLQYIAHCIATHPAIFSSSLEDQIIQLFVQPLRRACEEDPLLKPRPTLVILDGLDECDTPDVQRNILNVLEKALQTTPIPIVVLVASRPEIHISSTFKTIDQRSSIPTFHFGLNDKYDGDGDIRLYLNDKFKEIKLDHPFKKCLPNVWPLPRVVDSIVQKSSGQFIYAATVIRYIGHLKRNPHERLQTALNASRRFVSTSRDSPFKDLDALYFQIFSGVEDLMVTLSILYLALKRYDAQYPKTIAYRLGLDSNAVEIYISDLASLMRYDGERKHIRFFHASLQDFLVDEHRSHELYIEQPGVHTALSKAYLRHFLQSGPSALQLHFSLDHLHLAELDPELCHLAENVESQSLGILKAFHFKGLERALWEDFGVFEGDEHFSDFVRAIYNSKENLTRHTQNDAFWDQCLVSMHKGFRTQLPVYLADDNTHDLLAVVGLAKLDMFPRYHFASSFGISESAFAKCFEVGIFKCQSGLAPFRGIALEILRNFLLDRRLSGKLYVSSERSAQVAMKCLGIVKNVRLSKEVPGKDTFLIRPSHEENAYLCAVGGLTGMLRRASQCQQLLDALNGFDRRIQWLNHYPETLKKAQEAINTYLKTHSSKSPLGSRTQKQKPKKPVQAVGELSTAQRVRKQARDTSSGGTHAEAEGAQEAIDTYLQAHPSKSPPGGVIQKADPAEPVQAVDKLSVGQRDRKRARATSGDGARPAVESSTGSTSRRPGRQGAKKRKVKKP